MEEQRGMVTLQITQEQLDAGQPMSSDACPIALAIREGVGSQRVEVYEDHARIEGEVFAYSDGIVDWIWAYDHDPQSVAPMAFQVDYRTYRLWRA